VAWVDEIQQGNSIKDWRYDVSVAEPTVIGTYSVTDIYQACVDQSREDFPNGADTVVVASGDSWTDDITGASLAGDDSPLLLTPPTGLPPEVGAELTRLAPTRVLVVGGTSSISDALLHQIAQNVATDTVIERVDGSDAVSTSIDSLAVANATPLSQMAGRASLMVRSHTAIVLSATSFADAAVAAPVLSADGIPVVFCRKAFTKSQLERLKTGGVTGFVIVGGTGAVSKHVQQQLAGLVGRRHVTRLAGPDAYSTAARFDDWAVRHRRMTLDGVGIASKARSVDSLAASLLQGHSHSLLLLSDTRRLSKPAATLLKARYRSVRRAMYVGRGARLICRAARRQVRLILH